MKKIFLITIFLVLPGFYSVSCEEFCDLPQNNPEIRKMSLEEAVKTALEMNPQVKKALYDTRGYLADYDNAVSQFMPEISAYAEYLNGDAPSSYLFKKIDQRKLPENTDFNDPGSFDNFETGISAKMRLYNGNRTINSKKMAEQGIDAGKFMEDEIKNSLIFSVISVWYDILSAKDFVRIAKESVDAIEEQVRITRIKLKGGSALESDLLSLKARLLASKEDFMEAKNRCRIMRINLALITGLDPETEVDASEDDFQINEIPLNYNDLLEKSLKNSPYLKALKKQTEIAGLKQRIEKGGLLPVVDLKADYYHDDSDFKFSKDRANYRVGVMMGVKIFDGFSTSSRIKKANAMLKKAMENERQVLLQIKMRARKAFFDYELAGEKLKTAKLQKQEAEASYNLVRKQYEGGSADITRYLNAELARNSADIAERSAYYQTKKARAAMAEVAGLLYKSVSY
ncbi:MAG: TolC family protein [Desulfobacteraceae bacterium]|nr:TolC family protein [Desulfobacteraceae bacterium]